MTSSAYNPAAYPVAPPDPGMSAAAPPDRKAATKAFLEKREHGFPPGLINVIQNSHDVFPIRSWIVDNSGSMSTGDGNRLIKGADGRMRMQTCTRWQELKGSLLFHGELASLAGAHTEFRLLNQPAGAQQVVHCGTGSPEAEMKLLKAVVESSPTGRTPLCTQIKALRADVVANKARLMQNGQRHAIIIASDGAATDGNLAETLKTLEDLPVWVVVRLCTDDDSVVQYWNSIDEQVEVDMDVLDDLMGEAKEVSGLNSWLNYGLPLHLTRELGVHNKTFDLLDERTLHDIEVRQFVALLLGISEDALPHPEEDYNGFVKTVERLQTETGPGPWDPVRRKVLPWVRLKKKSNCSIV